MLSNRQLSSDSAHVPCAARADHDARTPRGRASSDGARARGEAALRDGAHASAAKRLAAHTSRRGARRPPAYALT